MMEETQISDLDKILSLLTEYTRVLRETCQRELERRSRRDFAKAVSLLILASGAVGAFFVLLRQPKPLNFSPLEISLYLIALLLLTTIFAPLFDRRGRFSYDADQTAFTLGKLTQMASQYSEHATKRVSDKFELELRLAEAEGVLRMHRQIFGREGFDATRSMALHQQSLRPSAPHRTTEEPVRGTSVR